MPNRELFGTISTSEKLNAVSVEAELLYIHMLAAADDWGLIEASPLHLKMTCFPGREIPSTTILQCIDNLVNIKLMLAYEVDGKKYLAFSKWKQKRFAKKPRCPLPPWGESHCEWVFVDPRARTDSATPPVKRTREPVTKANGHDVAEQVLAYLNERTGGHYKPVKANVALIEARIAEGATPADLCSVVDKKCAQWSKDDAMRKYLRPGTLFNREKFAQYQGEPAPKTTGPSWT